MFLFRHDKVIFKLDQIRVLSNTLSIDMILSLLKILSLLILIKILHANVNNKDVRGKGGNLFIITERSIKLNSGNSHNIITNKLDFMDIRYPACWRYGIKNVIKNMSLRQKVKQRWSDFTSEVLNSKLLPKF